MLQPSESQGDVKQSKEEAFFDWLIDNINEITKDLPKSNHSLLSLSKLLLSNEKLNLKEYFGSNYYQSHLVSGVLDGKEHIWIVIGTNHVNSSINHPITQIQNGLLIYNHY